MADLAAIFKAYDVRGTVPDQLDADASRAIGGAFARFISARGARSLVVGRDMRPTGAEFVAAFTDGAIEHGVDVVDIGLVATDMMYFASGDLDMPGAVFTASHNPAGYNGIKMCLARAAPIGLDTGLSDIRDMAAAGPDPSGASGTRTEIDLLDDYVAHVHSFVDISSLRPLNVVVDTANGMGGLVVPAVFRCSAVRARSSVPRARRDLPQSPGRPHPAREPA